MPKRDSDINQVLSLLFAIGRRIREHSFAHRSGGHLHVLHLETLRYVCENKHCSMKAVADYLLITPSSATVLVDSLVKSGYLKRIVDANDRRLIRLVVTDAGEKALKKSFMAKQANIRNILANLSQKELTYFIKILKKIAQ